MKILWTTILGGLLLSFPSTLAAQKVMVDFDHSVEFSQYKTFMWIREPEMADPLMKDRMVEAINAQLTSKGLQLVSAGADLGIVANAATRNKHTLNTFYSGYGGWRWGGWGMATTIPETYTVGTLVVDLFDARAKRVIWRGTSTETLPDKPDKTAEKLNKAVEKMFKDFPPHH
jgi:hypothetical protein